MSKNSCDLLIDSIHEIDLSGPLLWICSLGRDKRVFQFEPEFEVNIYPSIRLYLVCVFIYE